jgi:HK97 gp10 family phage protein
MSVSFEVTGFKELEKSLLEFGPRLARRSLARAVSSGAIIVREEARLKARSHGLYKTGALVKSIRVKKLKTHNWRTTQVYGVSHSKKGWYGSLYEGGFKDPQRHKPHLRPALDENTTKIINAIRSRLEKEIKVMRFERSTGQKFKKAFEGRLDDY